MKFFRLVFFLFGMMSFLPTQAEPVDFNLPDLSGDLHKLSDYRGKWVLVNFWATWCPPCLEEMPDLEGFHNKHKEKDAIVIGINQENISDKRLAEFIDEQFVSYPILKMAENISEPFGRITALPTSFLITPEGDVIARQVGMVTAEAIEKFIQDQQGK